MISRRSVIAGFSGAVLGSSCKSGDAGYNIVRATSGRGILSAGFFDAEATIALSEVRAFGTDDLFFRLLDGAGNEFAHFPLSGCSSPILPSGAIRVGPTDLLLKGCGDAVSVFERGADDTPHTTFGGEVIEWVRSHRGLSRDGVVRNSSQNLNAIAAKSGSVIAWRDGCRSVQEATLMEQAFAPGDDGLTAPLIWPFALEGDPERVFVQVIDQFASRHSVVSLGGDQANVRDTPLTPPNGLFSPPINSAFGLSFEHWDSTDRVTRGQRYLRTLRREETGDWVCAQQPLAAPESIRLLGRSKHEWVFHSQAERKLLLVPEARTGDRDISAHQSVDVPANMARALEDFRFDYSPTNALLALGQADVGLFRFSSMS